MNQWTPEWDTRPPRPDDYRPETPGPYTSPQPNLSDPYKPVKPPRWSVVFLVGVLGALLIIGLYVSASRDNTVVEIPNTVINPTRSPSGTAYDLPGQQSDPTLGGLAPSGGNARFAPQAHKPGPPVVR